MASARASHDSGSFTMAASSCEPPETTATSAPTAAPIATTTTSPRRSRPGSRGWPPRAVGPLILAPLARTGAGDAARLDDNGPAALDDDRPARLAQIGHERRNGVHPRAHLDGVCHPQDRRLVEVLAHDLQADRQLSLIHISEPTRLGMISYAV